LGVVQEDDDGHQASHEAASSDRSPAARPSPQQPRSAPQTGGDGHTTTRQEWFAAMNAAGLMEPDPKPDYPDGKKPSGTWYGICDKVGLPKAWSKYSPEEYAAAIAAIHEHEQRHDEPDMPDMPDVPDPFADQ